jgi:chorismate synthase
VANDEQQSSRYYWLPMMAVRPGMVTARPVVGLSGNRETMFVAVGSTISESTMAQMMAKDVECVAVVDQISHSVAAAEHSPSKFQDRLREIFGPEPDQACQALVDALVKAAPTLCPN